LGPKLRVVDCGPIYFQCPLSFPESRIPPPTRKPEPAYFESPIFLFIYRQSDAGLLTPPPTVDAYLVPPIFVSCPLVRRNPRPGVSSENSPYVLSCLRSSPFFTPSVPRRPLEEADWSSRLPIHVSALSSRQGMPFGLPLSCLIER